MKKRIEKTAAAKPAPRTPTSGLPSLSREAHRLAAAILEVLAGVRTPSGAAEVLALSLPRYYQLEQRALTGLLTACEPRSPGRMPTPESRIAVLEKEVQRWQQESARQQALVRAAQRSMGLAPPPKPAAKVPGQKPTRQRRPTARALKVASLLRAAVPEAAHDSSGASFASGLQPAAVAKDVPE